ncbi:MAG: twin-arginine translocation signal domain-containing protein [Mesorhizobium sp.]|nr:MAG: twin-arginine translocation signal domain-containing protein [Mesorhizobium sp.]
MNGDRSEANRWSAQSVPSQTLSRRKFLKVSMTGVAIAGGGGLASCMTG